MLKDEDLDPIDLCTEWLSSKRRWHYQGDVAIDATLETIATSAQSSVCGVPPLYRPNSHALRDICIRWDYTILWALGRNVCRIEHVVSMVLIPFHSSHYYEPSSPQHSLVGVDSCFRLVTLRFVKEAEILM